MEELVINEVINADEAEQVDVMVVVPDEVYNGEFEENEKGLNGVLIGAAIAATGLVAYKYAPKVLNKVKNKLFKGTSETLEERQTRLLAELSEVNAEILANEDVEETLE